MANARAATIDMETRSAAPLPKCGAWVYAEHPSTEILCMAFRLPDWEAGRTGLWTPRESDPADVLELLTWILEGGLVEAHNAMFERCMWRHVAVARYGWPKIPHRQWRCSAAKCASHALPRNLADAGAALGLGITKDAEGRKVMLKVSKPRKPLKKEREAGVTRLLWHETKALYDVLYAYCRQDVLAECAVSEAVPDLSEAEQEVYLLDQAMNERGFGIDGEAVATALTLIARETSRLTAELNTLTQGNPDKATKRAKLIAWLDQQGVPLEDTQKATVAAALKGDMDDAPRRVLEILREVGLASTAKYEAMRQWRAADGRAHGGLLYHGASTGRWSGAGVQPHNFPKGDIKDMEGAWQALTALL